MVTRPAMMRRGLVWLTLAVLSLASACVDEVHPRCGTIDACDIRTPECQTAALAYAACLRARNESTALQLPVTTQTRADYVAERVAEAQASDTPAERSLRRGLALFSLSPSTSTPESETRARYQNVIATYDGNPARIVVVDDGRGLSDGRAVVTLVHEMVHALQDAAGELDSARTAPRFDAQLALSAIVEGEASIAQDETLAQGYGYSFGSLHYGKALQSYRDQNLPYGGLRFGDVYSGLYASFSYAWGSSYLWPLQRDQGAGAIQSAHLALPVSTYAVMELDPTQPSLRPNDLGADAVPVLPDLNVIGSMHLGRFAYDSLASVLDGGWSFPLGHNFVADTLSVFTATDGAVLAVWRFRFDDPAVVTQTTESLARNNVTLPLFTSGTDFWLVAGENEALVNSVPTPLTFQAAPAMDFGFEQGRFSSAHVDCVAEPPPQ